MSIGLYVMLSVWGVILMIMFIRKVYYFGKYRGAKELHEKLVAVTEGIKKEEKKQAAKRPYLIKEDEDIINVDARYVTYFFSKDWHPNVYHN